MSKVPPKQYNMLQSVNLGHQQSLPGELRWLAPGVLSAWRRSLHRMCA